MANIYTYSETTWSYHNTTRVSDETFKFNGVGAYAETTILGEDLGGLGSDLFLRGSITPSQGKLTQGLCCRLDFYAKQKTGQDYWDIENHLIYLKGDKNGQINQKLSLIGFQGYFDHMVLRIEVMPDAELGLGGTIELTDFVIDDVSLNVDLSPVMDAIEEQGEAAKLMSDLLGLMMGVYPSRVMQQDGSFIYYWHDQPLMAESTTIWRLDANVFAVSNDGGQTWTGQTSDGTVIAKMVYALQIQASQVILSDGSDADEAIGELAGHFSQSGDFTLLENGYAAFVKRVTGSDPPSTGDYSTTTIDGGKIKAYSVTANKINVVALDGTGELDSTGGTLKVTQTGVGTVEISPSNPLKVTDSLGNFVGGLAVVDDELSVFANKLMNSPTADFYLKTGSFVFDETTFHGVRGMKRGTNTAMFSMGSVHSSIEEFTLDTPMLSMHAIPYPVSGGAMPWGAIVIQDKTNRVPAGFSKTGWSQIFMMPYYIGITSGNSALKLGTLMGTSPGSSAELSTGSHEVGVNSTGPYFTYNQSKTYFKRIETGSENMSAVGGSTVSQAIVFDPPFSSTPRVTVTPQTILPNDRSVSFSNITASEFTIYAYSTTTGTLPVHWIAVGN